MKNQNNNIHKERKGKHMTENTNNKRGRKSIFTDNEFVDIHKNASSINVIIEGLKNLGEQFAGQRKETYNKWIVNKTDKQLMLFVSMKASNLRKEGLLPNETRFKPGPKKIEAVTDTLEEVQQQEDAAAIAIEY